jgi:hypothetical protein
MNRFPPLLLILGTDLAGKDHCANVLTDGARGAGIRVERRRGAFSARPDHQRTSEDKSRFRLGLEWLFLATLPLHLRLLPYACALLIHLDLRRFRQPVEGSLLVVSHTALRLLAFALGHRFRRVEEIRLASVVERPLRRIVPATGAHTVVLDIDHAVRAGRMVERNRRGTLDYFDRYMGRDPLRSERIEQFLVWIGTTYLQAALVENNDLSDAELLTRLLPSPE